MRKNASRLWLGSALVLVSLAAGLGAGHLLWGRSVDWFKPRDVLALPSGPENDLIRYGRQIVVDTARHIGKNATDPSKRFAGNNLACTNCHLDAGLRPFAAPLVSTFASYPLMSNDQVITLADRINGCMTRSMNGRPLPENGREMDALIAYVRFIGEGTPVGVRVPGMGLLSVAQPPEKPNRDRGQAVFAEMCAICHGPQGEGRLRTLDPVDGYDAPPLWGDNSFNTAAGMNHIAMAAAFIRTNMPAGVGQILLLSDQQAWDVAAFITSQPRPQRAR
jgi:thiosulfate dehydrogenase